LTLLAALRRRAPAVIDRVGMRDVVPRLDAFENAVRPYFGRRIG
jgi:hypothetical protein